MREATAPQRAAEEPQERSQQTKITKAHLKSLIKEAAHGDEKKIEELLSPFLTRDERLISCGISAKMGILTTYDFYFLTDRRIGDLEITPLTGALNIESAYLHKVDAFAIRQPSMLAYRITMGILYVFFVVSAFSSFATMAGNPVMGALGAILAFALVHWIFRPMLRRMHLRFRKSGIFTKLTGGDTGTLIFSDRNRLVELTRLAREMTKVKRTLDKEAA